MNDALKYRRWNVYNEQLLSAWKKYNYQSNLIGQTFVFKKKKLFKTNFEERILSDTWLECSYDVLDKNNAITKFSNKRIREFEEFDNVIKNLQKIVLGKPDSIVKDFSIKCENTYITKQEEKDVPL